MNKQSKWLSFDIENEIVLNYNNLFLEGGTLVNMRD